MTAVDVAEYELGLLRGIVNVTVCDGMPLAINPLTNDDCTGAGRLLKREA